MIWEMTHDTSGGNSLLSTIIQENKEIQGVEDKDLTVIDPPQIH